MLMKELKEKKCISSRLYNNLAFRFRNTPNNLKERYKMIIGHIWNCTQVGEPHVSKEYLGHYYETLSFDEKHKIDFAYIDKMNQQYANTSLEEVLKELDVSEPEDIMRFRGLGKKCVSELQTLIERERNESKAI